jgi:tricorn protease
VNELCLRLVATSFTAPIRKGPTRNLTDSSGAHDKWPSWSPDGSQIAFISDKSGEEEIYLIPQDGSKPAEQITTGGTAMRYQPEWAPDGKRIAFSDKDGKLYVLTLADRKIRSSADTPRGQIRDYTWSPRGTSSRSQCRTTISLRRCLSGVRMTVNSDASLTITSTRTIPRGIQQGNYLYFLSDREFAPQLSNIEFNYATNRRLTSTRWRCAKTSSIRFRRRAMK